MIVSQSVKSLSTDRLIKRLISTLAQDLGLHWRDLKTLNSRIEKEGLPFVTKTLPLLSKAMLHGLGTGNFQLPSNFKSRGKRSVLPAMLGSLFCRIFSDDGSILPNCDHTAIEAVRQFCELAYKANVPRDVRDDSKVIENFVAVEDELSRVEIEDDPLLSFSALITTRVFSDYSRKKDSLSFRHGPGVTSNVEISQGKFESKLTPGLPSLKFGKNFFFNLEDSLTRLDRYPVWGHNDYFVSRNTAKVILVPKDSRGPRLISCEPCENQFVQQGIASYMIDKIEGHSFSGGQVNFTDQSINRRLAKEGSVSREWSTLDLKDASDRVSMQLVEQVFRGSTLLQDLRSARSQYTFLPDGRKVFLHKHAPMGSALCFPVMAWTLYVLAYSGLVLLGFDAEQVRSGVFVYGDDIVCRTEYARLIIKILENYHLKVNTAKSFIDSPFLESCGMDSFNGHDVTPIKLRECSTFEKVLPKKHDLLKKKPKTLVSLTKTAGLMSARGYRRSAEVLYTFVESWLGPLPYGHQESPYLCRLADVEQLQLIPELNFLDNRRIRWYRRNNLQRYPLGAVMEAWAIEAQDTAFNESFFGRLQRVWGQIGKYDSKLPDFGYLTLPRDFKLVRKNFDHYSMWSASLA